MYSDDTTTTTMTTTASTTPPATALTTDEAAPISSLISSDHTDESSSLDTSVHAARNVWGSAVLTDGELLRRAAAIAIAHHSWRRVRDVIEAHDSDTMTDYDMFRANVALCRSIYTFLQKDPVDTEGLRTMLMNRSREVFPGRTVESLGRAIASAVVQAGVKVVFCFEQGVQKRGLQHTLTVYAGRAALYNPNWWGTPRWTKRVERVLATPNAQPYKYLERTLKEQPDKVDQVVFEDVILHMDDLDVPTTATSDNEESAGEDLDKIRRQRKPLFYKVSGAFPNVLILLPCNADELLMDLRANGHDEAQGISRDGVTALAPEDSLWLKERVTVLVRQEDSDTGKDSPQAEMASPS